LAKKAASGIAAFYKLISSSINNLEVSTDLEKE